jgi:superfamily II DNA or RNA helicase
MIQLNGLSASELVITGPIALQEWRDKHQLPVPGREFMPLFRKHLWDGVYTPGKWCRQRGDIWELRCSRGLARRVVQDLGGSVEFNVAAPEQIAEFCVSVPAVAQLRDYQRRALEGVLREGWARVAYATNAGKGAVIALLAIYCQRRSERALILCDEVAVFDALQQEIRTWAHIEPGTVKRGQDVPPTDLITIAMVPTLARRLDGEKKAKNKLWATWLASQQMVLVDEADKADATRWKHVLNACKNSVWRAGFSGSFPDELFYDLKFDELMGPIIDRVTNAEMVERGVSAKPTIEVHSFDGTNALVPFPKDWWDLTAAQQRLQVYDRCVGMNQARHEFVAKLIRPETPTADRSQPRRAWTLVG